MYSMAAERVSSAPLIGCDGGRIERVSEQLMSDKRRPTPPSPEIVDDMTRTYQQNIRDSALWDPMLREFGEEEAQRILRKFRVEVR